MSKLTQYQEAVKESKKSQFILRWGRRTGKETVVGAIAGAKDVIIYPNEQMAKLLKPAGPVKTIVDPKDLKYKVGKVFVMEPALHKNLYEVLHYVKQAKPGKVYLIGTPMPSDDILSSQFLFNALAREASKLEASNIFFSLVGFSDAPFNSESETHRKQFNKEFAMYELDAKFGRD